MQCLKNFFAGILVLIFSIQLVFAGTTGKIAGTVKDKNTGEPLIGANVVLEGTSMGASTDVDGYFVIINVPPGTYNLSLYYVGYANTTIENVRINVDRTTTQKIEMKSATVEGEEVIVEGKRPAIEMDRTHSAAIVSSETVDLMPVTEVAEILELQGGVVSTGGQLHFRGGRSREVTYIVDGVPVTNQFSQNGGSNVNVETNMIAELEVISGTFNAEYGSAQSGVVNIVTKRPARKFSGSFQTYAGEFLSNQDDIYLDVSDFNPGTQKDVQFSLSGPIFKDKLGFFISGRHNDWESLDRYERRYNLEDGFRIAAYQNWAAAFNTVQFDGLIPIPDSLATGDLSTGPLRVGTNSSLNAKLLWTPHPKLTMSYQAFGSFDEYQGAFNDNSVGGTANRFRRYQPDGAGTSRDWEHSHFLKFQHFPSEKFFYNLSFSWQHNDAERFFDKQNRVAAVPGQPGVQAIAWASSGFSLGSTDGFFGDADGKNFQDQFLALANFNWQADKYNFIKAGIEAKQHRINVYGRGFIPTPEWADQQFPTNTGFLLDSLGNPPSYEEYYQFLLAYWENWGKDPQTGEVITPRFVEAADSQITAFRDFDIEPVELAAYVQDKLELGSDIIVNAGVRLDYFQPNEVVPINSRTQSFNLGIAENLEDAKTQWQLSPRLGISFPISANGAFHASYGHFFQMPSFQRMFNEPLVTLTALQLNGRRLGNANLKAERTIAYEIGLQQGLTPELSVDITAYYKNVKNLLGIEQLTTIDRVSYTRYVNRDYGNSKGISVGFTKNGGSVNGNINYTLAFANGSNSNPEALQLITISNTLGGESEVFAQRQILPLNWDQRHAVKAAVNFVKANNWSFGLVGFYETGVPFSPDFYARFDLNEREYTNEGIRPTQWSVDFKAKKNLNLLGLRSVIFFKVDNLFDHLNEESVYPTTGRALRPASLPEVKALLVKGLNDVGQFTYDETVINPSNFSSPRNLQLGLEFKF